VNFGSSGIIDWYDGDTRLARADISGIISIEPSVLNATVQLMSSSESNGTFNFKNFTLSANVSNFQHLEGSNITCGLLRDRSQPLIINEFVILNVSSYEGTQ